MNAIQLPLPEVKEIRWNDLTASEKGSFVKYHNWPTLVEHVPLSVLKNQLLQESSNA